MSTLLLTLFKNSIPYLVAGIAGFGLAFGIQELRLTHAEQEFTQYKQTQTQLIQEAKDAANKQRDVADAAYDTASKKLETALADGDAYRRCVAAGKCGRVRPAPACTGVTLPTTSTADVSGANAVPAPTGDAAINDCAVTTLMLNHLQADIEAQPGYSR